MCCLEVLVKMCELGVGVMFFSNILYAEHELRMCSTVKSDLQ